MADEEHILTDDILNKMEKKLFAIYKRANKEVGEKWKKYLKEIGQEINDLQDEYDLAKKRNDEKEIKKLGVRLSRVKKERTLMNKHFKNLTNQLAEELLQVNNTAMAYINNQLPDVYALNYNALEKSVKNIGGYSFELINAEVVKDLALSNRNLLPYKYVDEKMDVKWNARKLNAEILQGILQGEAMDKIALRFQNVVSINATSAIRNARTMVTGAENKGRQDSYAKAEADGIILERTWVATNDSRTRHSHAVLDGETKPIDTPFSNGLMYPGDPNGRPEEVWNCRCSVAAVVKGFKKVR